MRALITFLLILLLVGLAVLGLRSCDRKQEGPEPTHNSPALQPVRPNMQVENQRMLDEKAYAVGIAYAKAKYGDKLNYKRITCRPTRIDPKAAGMNAAEIRKQLKDPNYIMWQVTIVLTKVPVSQGIVNPTEQDPDNPQPWPISGHVFCITNNMKVSEGEPMRTPSFALERQ